MKYTHIKQNYLLATGTRVMFAAIGLALATCAPHAFGWGITWSDDFTGVNNQPYSGFWSYQTGPNNANNEIETYVSSWANAHIISDGTPTDGQALQIEAQTDSSGRWYSARIHTDGKHSFGTATYLEFMCKFPYAGGDAHGYWPAAWCLGTSGGNWPANGEIDVAEEVDGQWENYQTLHMPGWNPGTGPITVDHSTTTYHKYGVWIQGDGSYINYSIDGNTDLTIYRSSTPGGATWEYNPGRQFYILLNLAIGGQGSFPGPTDSGTQANGNFDIDYVHQWN
jgi:hypothetical protein